MFKPRHPRALTLIEAVLLLVIMSIVAVAAGVGLQSVSKVPQAADDRLAGNAIIVSVMEQTKANLIKNWPSTTWGGANYAFTANGTGFTPTAGTSLGASPGAGAGYSTPTSGTVLSINNKSYQLTLAIDKADPAGGASYKTDFFQVTVKLDPIINGSVYANSPQQVVTYVAQP